MVFSRRGRGGNGIVGEGTYTFQVDETLKDRFARAAEAEDLSGPQVLRDFMEAYVQQQDASDYEAWFRCEVEIGLASARAGHLIPGAEVEARFAAKRAATRRKLGLAD